MSVRFRRFDVSGSLAAAVGVVSASAAVVEVPSSQHFVGE
ncbi:hypothetical protein HMPREF1136_0271 [Actinomyces sp. ICM47]|nr:hypothetical protein HMPREF1136_0271 [Actinomyces sp. ICM47]